MGGAASAGRIARIAAALAVVIVLAPRTAAAQERPDSVAPADSLVQDTVPGDTLPPPPPPPAEAPRLSLDVFVGTLGLGGIQSQPVRADRLNPDSTVTSDTLRRTTTVESGFQLGASATWSFTPTWAARIGAAVATGRLEAGYSGGSDELRGMAGDLTGGTGTDIRLMMLEGAIRYRIPSGRRVQPYAEMGVGAARWSLDEGDLAGADQLDDESTRFSVLAGLGGTLALTPSLSAYLAVAGRWFRTPLGAAADETALAAGDSLTLTFEAPNALPYSDGTREMSRVMRLELGLSLGLGRVVARPTDQSEPVESTSDPPR